MSKSIEIPFINIRDLVIYPGMEQNLFIGREKTIMAMKYARTKNKQKVLVLAQKRAEKDNPSSLADMYRVGTICEIVGSVHFKDSTMKAVLRGKSLFKVSGIFHNEDVAFARGELMRVPAKSTTIVDEESKSDLMRLLIQAKPTAILDPDNIWLNKLRSTNSLQKFIQTMEAALNYGGPKVLKLGSKGYSKIRQSRKATQYVNEGVQLRQRILEEVSIGKKLPLIRDYLKQELFAWAAL